MDINERIGLLEKITSTINHDCHGKFVTGETERLDLIAEILKDTDYNLTVAGLCHLYSTVPVKDMKKDNVTVISSHVDTHWNITEPFSRVKNEKKLIGTYDNSITNAAILILMLENRLPDNVIVAFTGNEENGMKGATDLSDYLLLQGIRPRVIVTDVTPRGYKGKNVITLENCNNSEGWTEEMKDTLDDFHIKWFMANNYFDDETCEYAAHGFECLSLCIPTKGEMHCNEGIKARISAYDGYINALCLAAKD